MNPSESTPPPAASDGDPSKAELEVIGILNGRVVITKTTPIEIQQDMDNKLQVLRAHTREAVSQAVGALEAELGRLKQGLTCQSERHSKSTEWWAAECDSIKDAIEAKDGVLKNIVHQFPDLTAVVSYAERALRISPAGASPSGKPPKSSTNADTQANLAKEDFAAAAVAEATKGLEAELEIRTRQRDYWQEERQKLFKINGDLARMLDCEKQADSDRESLRACVVRLREALEGAEAAFIRYEIDVDVEAPSSHVAMMQRIDTALREAGRGGE